MRCLLFCIIAILLSVGKIIFFELEKVMTAANDMSFYLGRRDNHKLTLSNIFPSFNDVIKLIKSKITRFYKIVLFMVIESRINTKSAFIYSWNAPLSRIYVDRY